MTRTLSGTWRHTQPSGHPDQVRDRIRFHFSHDVAALHLHGDLPGPQRGGDLFIETSEHDPRHDFALPGRQAREALAQARRLSLVRTPTAIVLDRALNRVQ